MSIIANLITRVGCDVSNLLDGFEKSKSATRSYASDVAAIASGNLIAAGIEKGLGLIKELAHAIIEAAEEMKRLTVEARNLGIGTDTLQTLKFTAEEACSDIGELEKFMRKAAVAVIEKPKIFEQLGLDAQKLSGMGLDRQFEIIRDRLMEIENINDRISLANDIFGKGGSKALSFDVAEAREAIAEMGGGVDENAVYRLKAMADEMDKLWLGIKNAGLKFASQFAEVGTAIVKIAEVIASGVNHVLNALERAKEEFDFVITDLSPPLMILRKLYEAMYPEKKEPPPIVNTESMQAAKQLADDVEELTKKLEHERATMGMSAIEAEIYALKKRGASDAVLAHVTALMKSNEAIKKGIEEEKRMTEEIAKQQKQREEEEKRMTEEIAKQQKQREEAIAARARSITEANQTPEEKFKQEMAELNALVLEGSITWEIYERAKSKAVSGIPSNVSASTTANYAVEYGTQKMYDMIAKLTADNEAKQYQAKLLKQAEIQSDTLQTIAENTSSKTESVSI